LFVFNLYICGLEFDVVKKEFKIYGIPFVGLKIGKHEFEFDIDNTFFSHFDYHEFNDVQVHVDLVLTKKANLLELDFVVDGKVNVDCDVTMESFDMPIENQISLVVKFGQDYEEVNEELIILPHGEHQIEVQQYIYEAIVLSLPAKRVHPGVEDGTLDSPILDKLDELQPVSLSEKEEQTEKEEEEIDPRWDKLKDLLKDK